MHRFYFHVLVKFSVHCVGLVLHFLSSFSPFFPLLLALLISLPSLQDNMDEMPAAMLLVGNKVDLHEANEREVSTETGETFAKVGDKRTGL